jgi:hypothetical protein
MPSTEFLLYLIIVIFAVFVIMNYYKDSESSDKKSNSKIYRYIPVPRSGENHINYPTSDTYSKGSSMDGRSSMYNRSRERRDYYDNNEIDITNVQEGSNFPSGPAGPPGPPIPPIDPLRKFDYDSVNDDFTPPFRRSYYDEFNYRLNPALFPAYTRGPPGRFRKIGTLIADGVSPNDKYKFLLLMGRQKWPSGGDYEYYAMSPDSDRRMKFYIETRGKEIHHDDLIKIPEIDGYTYIFKEDKDLSPRYDPYLI